MAWCGIGRLVPQSHCRFFKKVGCQRKKSALLRGVMGIIGCGGGGRRIQGEEIFGGQIVGCNCGGFRLWADHGG